MAVEQNPFIACSKCFQTLECDAVFAGGFSMTGFIQQRCCSCMPKRICVHLDLYEYGIDAPTGLVSVSLELNCTAQSYSGTITDSDKIAQFAFSLYYVQRESTGQCYLALESSALGYTGDTTLLAEMGGTYNDGPTRRAECLDFGFAFDATVDAVAPYLDAAVIRVAADDLVTVPRNCLAETLCFAPRACISYTDSYGTVETQQVCFVDEQWQATFADGVTALIEIDNWDSYEGRLCESVPTLRLTSSLDATRTGYAAVDAECPGMTAAWDFSGGERITIAKDPAYAWNTFADCPCICRCICVTKLEDPVYATPPPRMMVGSACMSELSIENCGGQFVYGWSVTLVNSEDEYDTETVLFWLEYDCVTETTMLYTSVSATPSAINCPDFKVGGEIEQDISWSITPGGGLQPYLLQVRCLACTTCDLNRYVSTPCCPYFDIPAILTIEVTATNAECANLLGEVAQLIWNGDEFAPEWHGVLFDNEFILTCGGICGTAWCLSGCGGIVQQGDAVCEPLQIVFTSNGCGACDDPAMGEMTLTVTE